MDYKTVEPYILLLLLPTLRGVWELIRLQAENRVNLYVDVDLGECTISGDTGRTELYSYKLSISNHTDYSAYDVLAVLYSASGNERCYTVSELVADSPFIAYLPSDFGVPNLVVLRWKGLGRERKRRIPVHIPQSSMIDVVSPPKAAVPKDQAS